MTKHVFTIPPEAPFIDRLAEGLWEQAARDPLKLSEMLVLLPTRRACRYLREAFVRVIGRAVLLPRMQPLGDLDEAELYFAEDLNPDIPPAIAPLRRQLLLTQLVRKRDPDMPLDQAAQLAEALGSLLDQVQIERKDFSNLGGLAPENLAVHWQQTVKFLEIVTDAWPKMLAEEGCIDPADRRNRVIEAQAAAWRIKLPVHSVIAAGSTGSLPATGDLLVVIAKLPHGAVILPGLDQDLDEEAWQAIEDNHPQYSMKNWLEKCGVKRGEVKLWLAGEKKSSPRARLLQESMRPAEVSEGWRDLDAKKIPRDALQEFSLLTLDNAQEEAQTIALLMRGVLETPKKTAALITADRGLAERVAQELARWDIKINDSAGASLAAQPIGSFLLDVLAAAAPDALPIDYLSLLKHPLTACDLDPALCRSRAREAELFIWRSAKHDDESKEICDWFNQLKKKFEPFTQNWRKLQPLEEWIDRHRELAEQLAASDTQTGPERLWKNEAGEAASDWLSDWRSASHGFPPLSGEDYFNLFTALVRSVKVPALYGLHPRLDIFGLLEARLIQPALVILGGLNEGIWPPEPAIDPWMSRPMKKQFGLPLPEWRIGLSAHDFVQLASSPEVVLTRSRRAGNAPTVPSRFLLQLETVLRALGYHDGDDDVLTPNEPWTDWTRQLDEPSRAPKPCLPPEPKPPVKARPNSLNVTQIGVWRRNPYAIYARWILDLEKLEPLEGDATAADKGLAIHKVLERFLRKFPDQLPPNALDELLAFGREIFAPYRNEPQMAFWWPRFEYIAGWFIENEHTRRAGGIKNLASEAEGAIKLTHDFVLKGRADRIDRLPDGMLAIIDYKTGHVPSQAEVTSGFEPQLPLLALIAAEGGFKNLPAAAASELAYWKLSGGAEPGEKKPVKEPVDSLMKSARAGLENLIIRFADPNTPYLAVPRPGLQSRYDNYAHLARLAEWGRAGDEA